MLPKGYLSGFKGSSNSPATFTLSENWYANLVFSNKYLSFISLLACRLGDGKNEL